MSGNQVESTSDERTVNNVMRHKYRVLTDEEKAAMQTVKDMYAASVCIQTGSTPEITFADVSRKYSLDLRPVTFDSVPATRQAFFAGRCDALISDASGLASIRATQARNPEDYVIIPADEEITPLTPSVRHGDDQWFDIVRFS